MSQKETWKDNRTGVATGIDKRDAHWLSSVVKDNELVNDKPDRLRQEKVEEQAE